MISVILPVHNGEAQLPRCFSSIFAQSFKDFELLIVNNGSTDNSVAVCREWVEKYPDQASLFVVTDWGCLPAARNVGLDHAKGDYIVFVDADDVIEPDYLSSLHNAITASDADLVIAGFITETMYADGTSTQSPVNLSNAVIGCDFDLLEPLFKNGTFNPAWNKIFKASIIEQHQLRFSDGLAPAEDILFLSAYLKYCERIRILDNCRYHYIKDASVRSITGTFNPQYFDNCLTVHERLLAGSDFPADLLNYAMYVRYRALLEKALASSRYFKENKMNLKDFVSGMLSNEKVISTCYAYEPSSTGDRIVHCLMRNRMARTLMCYFSARNFLRNIRS